MKELWQEAGGTTTIKKILSDFYQRLNDDLFVGFLFHGHDLEKLANQQTAFISQAFGIGSYNGPGVQKAHEKMRILPGHFDRRIVILKQTLEDHKLDPQLIDAWIKIENSFRKMLISK